MSLKKPIIKILVAVFVWLSGGYHALSQQQFTDYKNPGGVIMLDADNEIYVPASPKGYTLLLPENEIEVVGLVVLFEGTKRTLDNIPDEMELHPHAFKDKLGVLYISTGNPVDFFFDYENMDLASELIERAIKNHDLNGSDLFFAGMSLGGTRALRFNMYCKSNPEICGFEPKAIAIADAPLDMHRFWKVTKRAERIDFHPVAAGEGRWVSSYLEQKLGGTPKENPKAYEDYSPYMFTEEDVPGNNTGARFLQNIPIRAYHEPDVNWWIENRRMGYYSMNSIDMAGLINALKIMGNDQADLITTHNERADIKESPHTWSIVNNAELMNWFGSISSKE